MRIRALVVLALVAAVIVAPASAAHAQCGLVRTVEQSLAEADVAFVGRVVDRSNLDRTAVMQVLEVWKGASLPSSVTVNGGPEDMAQQTSIDRTFLLSQIYLVMPANSRSPFQDSLCSGTQLWSTPTGSIPSVLQSVVGRELPILIVPGGVSAADDGGSSGLLGTLGIGVIVIVLALGLIFGVRRFGLIGGTPKRKKKSMGHAAASGMPRVAFRPKRRRLARFSMPGKFTSKRGSRIDQVRRAARRGRNAPGEQEKEQLRRAVQGTATRPPSRRNHYTSGRRSAP